MLRTLLVPLDGSELAERALPYAVRIAAASGGRLAIIRVEERSDFGAARSYLEHVAEKLANRIAVQTRLSYGKPVEAILTAVEEFGADEIVMATHGRTGPTHLLYGSVAEAVLGRSSVPVFLVHARSGEAPAPPFDLGSARILVPLDGSPFSEAALPVALAALGIAGELLLVRVVQPSDDLRVGGRGPVVGRPDQHEAGVQNEALAYLQATAGTLRQEQPGIHVACDIRLGDAANGIVMAQIDRGADLVAMATHGRTGLGRSVMGSVAGAVLRTGTTPLLLVHPTGLDTREPEPEAPSFIIA